MTRHNRAAKAARDRTYYLAHAEAIKARRRERYRQQQRQQQKEKSE